jgi:hypothetical protein
MYLDLDLDGLCHSIDHLLRIEYNYQSMDPSKKTEIKIKNMKIVSKHTRR